MCVYTRTKLRNLEHNIIFLIDMNDVNLFIFFGVGNFIKRTLPSIHDLCFGTVLPAHTLYYSSVDNIATTIVSGRRPPIFPWLLAPLYTNTHALEARTAAPLPPRITTTPAAVASHTVPPNEPRQRRHDRAPRVLRVGGLQRRSHRSRVSMTHTTRSCAIPAPAFPGDFRGSATESDRVVSPVGFAFVVVSDLKSKRSKLKRMIRKQ